MSVEETAVKTSGGKATGAGLRGQSAGQTAIATVGKAGVGLTYRGYPIETLAEHALFEEVAYLLIYGKLPNRAELDAYLLRLSRLRGLPRRFKETLERIPRDAHPMDVLRTGCSMLGALEPEGDFSRGRDVADRLLAVFPSMLCYWHRFATDGKRIETETDDDSVGGHFLHLLHGRQAERASPSGHERLAHPVRGARVQRFDLRLPGLRLDAFGLLLRRLCGDRHASRAASRRRQRGGHGADPALPHAGPRRAPALREMLARKEKIMGFGHAVYRERDPRQRDHQGLVQAALGGRRGHAALR